MASPRATMELLKLLHHGDRDELLAEVANWDHAEANVQELLNDRHEPVRLAAREALAHLQRLRGHKDSRSPAVTEAAELHEGMVHHSDNVTEVLHNSGLGEDRQPATGSQHTISAAPALVASVEAAATCAEQGITEWPGVVLREGGFRFHPEQ